MENYKSPYSHPSPKREQSSPRHLEKDDRPENEDDSDAILMRLLNASVKGMDQESEPIMSSRCSAHNYESVENVESFPGRDEEENPKGILGITDKKIRVASPSSEKFRAYKQRRSQTESLVPTSPSFDTILEQNEDPELQSRFAAWNGKAASDGGGFKGEIRTIGDGSIEWKDEDGWVPAVFHNSIREKLIKQAEQLGGYDHRRRRGLDPHDITCFHPDQKTWGPDRDEQWPLMPDQLLFRLERQGYPVPDYEVTLWIDEGRVVLDIDNLPVKKYHSIPLTLSSEMEAYLMEMIGRMDTRITHRDLRARMPHTIQTGTGTKPILSISAIGMRLKRFRLENACPQWTDRLGTGALKTFVMNLLSEESLKRNSTRELGGLTKLQQEMVKKESKRRYLSTAGTRNLNFVSRTEQEQADARRWARLEAADKDKNEGSGSGEKRKRDADSLLVFDRGSSTSPQRSSTVTPRRSSTSTPQPAKFARCESEGPGGSILERPSSSKLMSPNDLPFPTTAPDHSFQGKGSKGNSTSQRTCDASTDESALLVTVLDYRFYLGYDPPPTNQQDDFETQYNDIQKDFNVRWNGHGPAPKLLNLQSLFYSCN